MFTLYTRPQTGGFAVHAVLEEAGLEHTIATVDDAAAADKAKAFRDISPLGQVPVLSLPDGTAITESAAMCTYLADLVPAKKLSPALNSPLRPHFLRWLTYASTNLYAADLRCYYAQRYTTDPEGADHVRDAALAEMNRLFDIVEDALNGRKWLLGNTYSAADIYLAMIAYWHPDVPGLLKRCSRLNALCDAVRARPAVARAAEYHKPWTFDGTV